MSDGSTPAPQPAPFAVGYGNGYGYESLPPQDEPTLAIAAGSAPTAAPDLAATVAVTRVDLAEAAPGASVASRSHPPYVARPVGSAHPRRRLGRGLALASVALLATATGIGAVALGSSRDLAPASASAPSAGSGASARSTSSAGGALGGDVDPIGTSGSDLPPVSIIESPTITRLPAPVLPTTTAAPTTTAPTTTPPATNPTPTAPATTAPATTTPATTTPATTTPPTTSPAIDFTSLIAPHSVDCPSSDADGSVTFSWSAPGALQVTLSIDGPGVYRTYVGASGSETVSFPCSQAHTYLFVAHGPGGTASSESITIVPS